MEFQLSPEDAAPRIPSMMSVNARMNDMNHLLIHHLMTHQFMDGGLHSPHTDGLHRTDHPSRETTPSDSPAATPSGPSIDPGAGELMHSPRVMLPKLSLKRFNRDLTKWMTFWDTFESAVHNNPTLTSIDKYLNSLLEPAVCPLGHSKLIFSFWSYPSFLHDAGGRAIKTRVA